VHLTRLDRPIGIYLVMWPTLWALWIAGEGRPTPLVFVVFVLGTILMRSAGCAINDFADRHIDLHVSRTKQRPLARGAISPKEAVAVFAVLSLVAFALVLLMNRLTIMLSVVGVLLAFSYPFTKRYTYLPQAYLGIAFGWGIPMAFAAETGSVPQAAWGIVLISFLVLMMEELIYLSSPTVRLGLLWNSSSICAMGAPELSLSTRVIIEVCRRSSFLAWSILGLEKKYPWKSSNPIFLHSSYTAAVSTFSASTLRFLYFERASSFSWILAMFLVPRISILA